LDLFFSQKTLSNPILELLIERERERERERESFPDLPIVPR
jgi:hypothetical protein